MFYRAAWIIMIALFFIGASLTAQEDEATEEPASETRPETTPEVTAEVEDATCPALVQRALQVTREGCEGAEQNEVCYGHLLLDAVLRSGVAEEEFDTPGEIVDVIEVENLNLSALDTITGVWGVVLMQLQASLDLESDDSDVTYVVFGDATLESASQLIPIRALQGSNIRETPSTSAAILRSVEEGQILIASGRTEDSTWLRIRLQEEGDNIIVGWVFAELIKTDLDLEDLPIISEGDVEGQEDRLANYGPMQAFYFSSAEDDAPCSAAPNSGMLIQTPEGQASVSLWIDEVVVELTATAYVQAQANGDITVNVLDGTAQITANGETRTAIEGTSVSVPLDENLGAAGVPEAPEPIDPNDVQSLPTTLLNEQISISDPLDIPPGAPAPGSWMFHWGADSLTCSDGTEVAFTSSGSPGRINIIGSGEAIEWSGFQYARVGSGVYSSTFVDSNGNLHQDTLTVQAMDRISGLKIVDYATNLCSLEVPFSLTLVGN